MNPMASSMHRVVSLALASAVVGLGCGPSISLDDASGTAGSTGDPSTTTGTTAPGTTMPGATTLPPDPDDADSTTGGGLDSIAFLDSFGDCSPMFECDLFLQDCPDGEKCMPWANDGGNVWNATRCSPIDSDPAAVGEPCMVKGGPASGLDTCDQGAMCWDLDLDTLEGTCTAFCLGTPENPTCKDPNAQCATEEETALALCLPLCDPLLQDCAGGQACYPVEAFSLCVPDRSGEWGAPGDPCEYLDVCDPGNVCLDAAAVPMCEDALGCCSPLCDLTDPMPPCPPGQVCAPWYEGIVIPAGYEYEDVGACTLPV